MGEAQLHGSYQQPAERIPLPTATHVCKVGCSVLVAPGDNRSQRVGHNLSLWTPQNPSSTLVTAYTLEKQLIFSRSTSYPPSWLSHHVSGPVLSSTIASPLSKFPPLRTPVSIPVQMPTRCPCDSPECISSLSLQHSHYNLIAACPSSSAQGP